MNSNLEGKQTARKGDFTWIFGQPWLPQVEPAFAPGWVEIGRENDDLLIHAELQDAHVMKDVFAFNFPAFMQCDTFEIFLGPADENAYYELHVTPSNSVLQLFFDGSAEKKSLEERMVGEPLFSSETAMTSDGWSVSVRIPLTRLFPGSNPEWLLSFGRYDYTPGESKPVISSTSPHTVCNFHRKEEWRRVRLDELSSMSLD
jgi:hypothetical protein